MADPSEFEDLIGPRGEHLERVVMNAAPVETTEIEYPLLAYAACTSDARIDLPDPDFASGMIDLGDIGAAASTPPAPRADLTRRISMSAGSMVRRRLDALLDRRVALPDAARSHSQRH